MPIPQKLKEERAHFFEKMEQRLNEMNRPKDSLFFYHSSEDRVVLSHALFWVMTKSIGGSLSKEEYFQLLRKYQEEMLDAYLTESDYFPELLHYCNIIYETLPHIFRAKYNLLTDRVALKLAAISSVAIGYGGDMDDDLCNELLDDMDFQYNRVKCRKIEQMLPELNILVDKMALDLV